MAQRSTHRIILVTVLLAAVSALLWWPAVSLPPYHASGAMLSWWQLALLSAAAELFVLHIQVRREAQAISLSEVPQVLGLFLATPVSFGIGRVVGVLLVCLLRRRQPPLKLAFNGVQIALESAIALLVFHQVLDLIGDGTPARWAAAFAASAAVGAFSALSITAVVALAEATLDARELVGEPLRGALASVAVAVPGLMVVGLIEQSRWNAILALLALAALVVGYRAYAVLSERHLTLERLYRFSQVVSDRPEVDQVLQTILDQASQVLRANHAEVLFLPGEAAQHAVRVAPLPGGRLARTACSLADHGPWARAVASGDPVLVPRDSRAGPDRAYLGAQGLRDTIIVPMRGEAGLIGALMVADRIGEVRTFDADDVRLLETVANHASVALRNGRLIDQLRHEAAHDALTGLPNRSALARHLQQVLHDRRAEHPAVLLLDLDGFKQVNDTLGHHQGDALLQQVAARLRSAVPLPAQVARLGGDEFAIVVPAVRDQAEAVETARQLLTTLLAPLPVDGIQLEVSASIGVAIAQEPSDDAASLFRRADMAMYEAKQRGRGAVAVFDPATTHQDTPAQLALAGELRRAIAGDELRLFVQPKADAGTGAIVGVEALVRWQHPELGLIMPDEFIPIAERNGLIRRLTTTVLRSAIGAVAAWERDADLRLSIAVNLSPRGLGSDLPAQVAELLAERGTSASMLTLELTESSMMNDPAGVATLMAELHRMGVKLSIDDFGTGYSSLSSLRKLPLDEIKIDKSFVMGIEENGDDEKIVRSIIDLGTNLGLTVVAEGVENNRIWRMLRRMGCTQVQGYYLTRPIPIEDFPDWLASYRELRAELAAAG